MKCKICHKHSGALIHIENHGWFHILGIDTSNWVFTDENIDVIKGKTPLINGNQCIYCEENWGAPISCDYQGIKGDSN